MLLLLALPDGSEREGSCGEEVPKVELIAAKRSLQRKLKGRISNTINWALLRVYHVGNVITEKVPFTLQPSSCNHPLLVIHVSNP